MATPPPQPPGGPGRGAKLLDTLRKRQQQEKLKEVPSVGRGRAALMQMMKRSASAAGSTGADPSVSASPSILVAAPSEPGDAPPEASKEMSQPVEIKKPAVPVSIGRGRGALMARIAAAKSGGDQAKDTTFQSDQFETSSRLSNKIHCLFVLGNYQLLPRHRYCGL